MHDENNKGCPWNRTIGKQNWAADGNCTCSPAPRQHEEGCSCAKENKLNPNGHEGCDLCKCTPTSAPVEGWEEEFEKKHWGAMFECGDYEKLLDDIRSIIAKERAIAENEGARQERQIISLNLAATYGTAFRKDGVGFYLPSVAEIREEARADERKKLIEEVREWANNYMEETTKHYGTDKHGIDPDDLGDYLSSLAANNKSS